MRGTFAQVMAVQRAKLARVAQATAGELSARLVSRSPVDTGRMRRSWVASQSVNSIQPGDSYRFSTTLSYARVLEYGWSAQAPRGFLRITALEFPDIVEAAVRQARS